MSKQRWSLNCALAALCLLAGTGTAFASGFGIFTQGAAELGQANSSIAHTSGASAVYFNPALMSRLSGTQVEFGTTLVAPDREFTSASTGSHAEVENTIYFPSHLYLTHQLSPQMNLGLAVYNPFGLGTDWPDTWEGKYLATKSTITTFNFNPAISYKISPQLTLAAGVNVLLLDAELERKRFDIGGANQKFSADGDGFGYNLGLLFDLTPSLTFGAAYRSEIDLTAKGNVQVTLPGLTLFESSAQSKLTMPQQLTAGLAWKQSERLTVEAGVRWEGWSAFDTLTVRFPNGSTDSTPKDWRDTWAANLGARYQLNPTVALLGGYLYGPDAVPAATFEPAVPDSTSHLFTLGTDLKFDRIKLAASYGYQYLEERSKNNSVGGGLANGDYNSSIHLLSVGIGYQF